MTLDTKALASRLQTIESVAMMSTATSTNLLARRIAEECIENELPFPSAVLIAREQTAGKGRIERVWHSPRDRGIYVTILHSRPPEGLALVPLETGVLVASFLGETYGLEAGIKWPNDILVAGKKIAGILIEAKTHEDSISLMIGVGVNVEPLGDDAPENATSIADQVGADRLVDLDSATEAFIEHLDKGLGRKPERETVLSEWRALATHRKGDRISVCLPSSEVSGTWDGIDDQGRAVIRHGDQVTHVAAGDLIVL